MMKGMNSTEIIPTIQVLCELIKIQLDLSVLRWGSESCHVKSGVVPEGLMTSQLRLEEFKFLVYLYQVL